LRNFDPEHSEREKRKLYRRLYQNHRKYLYDDNGIFMQTSDDLCDCLNSDCQGCHFPCLKCFSPKCAHECRYCLRKKSILFYYEIYLRNNLVTIIIIITRNNRKWTYDSIHCEGTDSTIKNPLQKES